DAVGEQYSRARLGECFRRGFELITCLLHGSAMADIELWFGWRRAPKKRLEIKTRSAILRALVGDEHRGFRLELLNFVDVGEEDGFFISHELGESEHTHGDAAGRRALCATYEPLFVADDDPR